MATTTVVSTFQWAGNSDGMQGGKKAVGYRHFLSLCFICHEMSCTVYTPSWPRHIETSEGLSQKSLYYFFFLSPLETITAKSNMSELHVLCSHLRKEADALAVRARTVSKGQWLLSLPQ